MRRSYFYEMQEAYCEAAYFTDTPEDIEEDSEIELTLDFKKQAYEACVNFENACCTLEIDISELYPNPEQIGHDLWLTRNGHGAGFWDRKEIYGDHADLFTGMARAMGYHEIEFTE